METCVAVWGQQKDMDTPRCPGTHGHQQHRALTRAELREGVRGRETDRETGGDKKGAASQLTQEELLGPQLRSPTTNRTPQAPARLPQPCWVPALLGARAQAGATLTCLMRARGTRHTSGQFTMAPLSPSRAMLKRPPLPLVKLNSLPDTPPVLPGPHHCDSPCRPGWRSSHLP